MEKRTSINNHFLLGGLLLIPLGIFAYFNYDNLYFPFSLILGLLSLPYVLRIMDAPKLSFYGGLSLVALGVLLFYKSNSLYYFGLGFLCLWVLERSRGQLNWLPFFLLVVCSPVVGNVSYIWSFPIRLRLSEWATQALQFIGMDVVAEGNVIWMNGQSFSVDPACMGLNMLITSLVIALIVFAYFEHKTNQSFRFWEICLGLLFMLFLAIVGNFTRLLALIIFHILPEHPLHDGIGMMSLLFYAIVPFYFLVNFYSKKRKKEIAIPKNSSIYLFSNKSIFYGCYGILLSLLIMTGFQFRNQTNILAPKLSLSSFQNYQQSTAKDGVLKLENDSAIIHIKPPVQIFQGSHDPRFCWQGSGYTFQSIKREIVNKRSIYTAILQNGEDQLYTAWWLDNGTHQTIEEWEWRWQVAKGAAGYYLINITTENRAELIQLLKDKRWNNWL